MKKTTQVSDQKLDNIVESLQLLKDLSFVDLKRLTKRMDKAFIYPSSLTQAATDLSFIDSLIMREKIK